MVTFTEPTAGMFVWLKVPGIPDTKKLIYEKALAQEVLFIPGNAFFVDQDKTYPFVRVSYSLCTPEQIETVILSPSINRFHLLLLFQIGYGSFW